MPLASPALQRLALALLLAAGPGSLSPSIAQVQKFILGPGSNVGASTRVVPINCYRSRDGSISCDTKLLNPAGNTQAKPQYSPFSN
ncbi:MAG: hypothetical protein ACKN89_05825 [Cyanobium sp.]|jgi:hypothetical protein|nr:hypothetical protein [Synechococcaceae cyanobacterium]